MCGDHALARCLAIVLLTACNATQTGGGGGGSGGAGAASSTHAASSGSAPLACTPGEGVACYDGPAGTRGVGRCRAGLRTCAADGAGYGPCTGEILPGQEVCGWGRDDDCNGAPVPCAHVPAWGKAYGQSSMPTAPLGLILDAGGNLVFLTQYFGTSTTASLVTLNPWGNQLQRIELANVEVLAAAPGGGFVVVGVTNDQSPTLDIHRYDAGGAPLFVRSFPVNGTFPAALAVNAAGEILLAGNFINSIDFGGGLLVGPADPGIPSAFVAKLAPDGSPLWAKRTSVAASGEYQGVKSVSFDPAGNVFLVGEGSPHAVLDFGAGPVLGAGQHNDVFVAKLDPAGAPLWARRYGDDIALDHVWGKADAQGNVVLAGSLPFPTTIDFGGGPIGKQGNYVAVLDPTGSYLRGFDAGDAAINDFALGPAGDVMIIGQADATSAAVDWQVSLARWSVGGTLLASWSLGDPAIQTGGQVALDPTGAAYITASSCGTIDVGSGPVGSVNPASQCSSFVGFVPLP